MFRNRGNSWLSLSLWEKPARSAEREPDRAKLQEKVRVAGLFES